MMASNKLLVVIILLFSTISLAGDLFDSSLGNNEEQGSLEYNAPENNWNYGTHDDTLKYNVFQDRWTMQVRTIRLSITPLKMNGIMQGRMIA